MNPLMLTLIKSIQRGMIVSALLAPLSPVMKLNAATFGDDAAFLKQHTPLLVLSDQSGNSRVAVAQAWQGRVMTSSANGDGGASYGWINRELISSGKLQPHINVFGGEDRFWLGPEGGQFSVFFAKGAKFELNEWFTPAPIDTMAYRLEEQTKASAVFKAQFTLTNYSGTRFEVAVDRKVSVLQPATAWKQLGVEPAKGVSLVAYESINTIKNVGREPWSKQTGLLSVWILGMFNPSPSATIVVPIRSGSESQLGVKVTSDYFGPIPPDRLVVKDDVIYLKADGQHRGKIGINPRRSKALLGSYDSAGKVLTIVQFTQPEGVTDYVNSQWKIQDNPYGGDAANSYNDGAPSPGVKQLGPFYELESSSPGAALAPGKSLTHRHRTTHLSGDESALNSVARTALGVSLREIQNAFSKR